MSTEKETKSESSSILECDLFGGSGFIEVIKLKGVYGGRQP